MKKKALIAGVALSLCLIAPRVVLAEAPDLQTQGPVIYLADNLDDEQNLGWCIDTLGRGFSEQIQAHSCKPQGGDVQFSFDPASGQIASVEFAGKCMTLSAPENTEVPFGLLDCSQSEASQQFTYDAATQQIRLASDPAKCVAVGQTSRAAGPFMSRDLTVAPCEGTEPAYLQWIIRD